jgi:hypothetical protein
MMVPRDSRAEYIDVTSAMSEQSIGRNISLNVLMDALYTEETE